ncbi:MAG: class I SAM-dependent methyltransferase [Bacteroidota bacterium]
MPSVPGTKGYEQVVEAFIEGTLALPFEVLHADFLPFFPTSSSRVLDVGSGIGRDAYAFYEMGHRVTAVEPLPEFVEAAKKLFPTDDINWIEDSLPALGSLHGLKGTFDFVLASANWHHLSVVEQELSMLRIADLLAARGRFTLSLRNGPAGSGTYVFPTSVRRSLETATTSGLRPILVLENQPSLMKHKKEVKWDRIVFEKVK